MQLLWIHFVTVCSCWESHPSKFGPDRSFIFSMTAWRKWQFQFGNIRKITKNSNFKSHFLENGWSFHHEILHDNLEDQAQWHTVFFLLALKGIWLVWAMFGILTVYEMAVHWVLLGTVEGSIQVLYEQALPGYQGYEAWGIHDLYTLFSSPTYFLKYRKFFK